MSCAPLFLGGGGDSPAELHVVLGEGLQKARAG